MAGIVSVKPRNLAKSSSRTVFQPEFNIKLNSSANVYVVSALWSVERSKAANDASTGWPALSSGGKWIS